MIPARTARLDPQNPDPNIIKEAGGIIRAGGLVIIPTETVYGIAADSSNKKAIERLYEIKKRPLDKPFSLLIDAKEKAGALSLDAPASAFKLMDKFWPGPLTVILKSRDKGAVGLRVPDNKIALKLILEAGSPLACPSANISGKPAPADFQEAIRDLSGLVDFAIDSGSTKLKMESSVVDFTSSPPRVLREGAIKKEALQEAIKSKTVLFVCTGNSCRSVMAKALLEKRLKEKNRGDIEVLSAGILMLNGMQATEETKEALAREGIDVSGHRSQMLTKEMINAADIILVMERMQEKRILELAPEAKNKLFLLKEFAKINDNNLDIADPIGRPMEFYLHTLGIIKDAVERITGIL